VVRTRSEKIDQEFMGLEGTGLLYVQPQEGLETFIFSLLLHEKQPVWAPHLGVHARKFQGPGLQGEFT
jgi:hypothetical protein